MTLRHLHILAKSSLSLGATALITGGIAIWRGLPNAGDIAMISGAVLMLGGTAMLVQVPTGDALAMEETVEVVEKDENDAG
ncbi:hypothetical protein [Parerythrobacter aestuarii]|uniref:hypothetical protein n=1 Tax=Parerythrobacter aestuarii TaxID=3020909 RepID=UPI0024DEB18C|nr:hypothetical protein [Parerythrobacter aestuarii]